MKESAGLEGSWMTKRGVIIARSVSPPPEKGIPEHGEDLFGPSAFGPGFGSIGFEVSRRGAYVDIDEIYEW
jgi:hypothetical protein